MTPEELKQISEAAKAAAVAVLDEERAKQIDRKFTPGLGDEGRPQVTKDEGDQPFAHLGQQLMAVRDATVRGLGSSSTDKRLFRCIGEAYDPITKKAVTKAPTGLGETVPSDGAFLVAQEFIPTLLDRTYQTGKVFGMCAKQPVGPNFNGFKIPAINETSRVDGSRWGGVQAYWGAEASTITASKPAFRQISVVLQKLFALCYVTDELLEDSVALEGYVNRWFPAEMGFKLDDAIINGDGAGKPLGVLNGPGTLSISKETNQTATTIVTNNILKMWRRLWGPSMPNAVWLINQDCLGELETLTIPIGTAGTLANLYTQPGGGPNFTNQTPYGTIKSRPVIPIEQCATLGTVGDIILVDLSQYIVGQKGGMAAATSIHVSFTTDQTAFRFIMRVNGEPVWHSALTPYKGSNTLSPYITLATRA